MHFPSELKFHWRNRSSADPRNPSHNTLNIPGDIWLEIAEYLCSSDLLRLSLAARRLHELIVTALYAAVDICSSELCRSLLKFFAQRPDLTRHVKKLVVRPNQPPGWANRAVKPIDETWVATMIVEMARMDRLMALDTFLWDGLEMPIDTLWLTLRNHCPNIRNIGTSVGPKLQNFTAESSLFAFRNLTGFTLTTQRLNRWPDFKGRQELPSTFWDMLLAHSPDLRELTLDPTCRTGELWALRKVLKGRWPKLRTLCVGVLSSHEIDDEEDSDQDLIDFLEAHQTLFSVATVGTTSYTHNTMNTLTSLPRLSILSTKLQRLKDPSPLCSIKTLLLRDWFSPAAKFDDILGNLTYLETLSLCINYSNTQQDRRVFFSRLLTSCPTLTDLHILSTTPVSLSTWEDSLKSCQTNLGRFTLTRTTRTHEDTLPFAIRIAQTKPSLHEFIFRDVAPTDHETLLNGRWRTRQLHTYTIVSTHDGRLLRCRESGVGSLGSRYTKTFSYELPVVVHAAKSRVGQVIHKIRLQGKV